MKATGAPQRLPEGFPRPFRFPVTPAKNKGNEARGCEISPGDHLRGFKGSNPQRASTPGAPLLPQAEMGLMAMRSMREETEAGSTMAFAREGSTQ